MRVNSVVVFEPSRQLAHDRCCVSKLRDASVISLHRAHERLGHSVRLGALDRGGARLEADVTSKALGVVCDVSGAVVGQPFDGRRQSIDRAEPVFKTRSRETSP